MRKTLAVAAALGAALAPAAAAAGGLFLPSRGVRPTARGGAFVAGADDVGALWFNPAGLAALTRGADSVELMLDVAYVDQTVEYRRVDSGGIAQPMVTDQAPGAPIPTVGASFAVGRGVVVATGLFAPYAALSRYDDHGPQRYSLVDSADSVILTGTVALAWQATPTVRVGAALQNHFASLASSVVFSGCPGQTVCAPEDPEFDSLSQFRMQDHFNPSGVVGAQLALGARARLGVAVQLPARVAGQGTMTVRLPPSGFFDGAQVVGDRARMAYDLPAMVRAGVEVEPAARWRVEAAVDYERWSRHQRFRFEPEDVRIEGTPGVGTYEIGDVTVERGFEDTLAFKLGIEGQPSRATPLRVLAGYAFETAAAPDALLSVLAVDGTRHLVAGGLAYRFGATEIAATFAHVAVADRRVDPAVGMAEQLSPIREPDGGANAPVLVNWGDYHSSWLVAGLAITTRL